MKSLLNNPLHANKVIIQQGSHHDASQEAYRPDSSAIY